MRRFITRVAAASVLAALSACAAEQPQRTGIYGLGTPDGRAINRPAGFVQTSHVIAAVVPFGSVPYDNLSLPMVSPDGRFVATQTGVPPTWETIRAEPDASVPAATRIEIHALDLRTGIEPSQRQPPRHVTTLDEPALLGRACDARGFLIESPRADGSRWIGHASWESGEITWLVADENVNAFATLGRDGRLAWSRRAVGAEHFDLVVRRDGQEISMPAQSDDWLMPTWGSRGDGLFMLHLANERLTALYMLASSEAALRQSIGLQTVFLADGASIDTAVQTVSGQIVTLEVPSDGGDEFVFLHPARARMAVWRPLLARGNSRVLLAADSFAALPTSDGFALVGTYEHFIRQDLSNPLQSTELLTGMLVPRRLALPEMPFVLLGISPNRAGRIGISGMALLPAGTTASAQ